MSYSVCFDLKEFFRDARPTTILEEVRRQTNCDFDAFYFNRDELLRRGYV